jgi:regulator of cell morphogenesis and NO signaling
MLIQKEMKMADVIHHDHFLIPVINRFGIHLGFGDKTIEELCRENNVNTVFFLTILNAYHDHEYFPRKHLQSFPAHLLVNYLVKSHQYYLEIKVPEIEKLIDELPEETDLDKETLRLLQNFFLEYKQELINHIQREEERVYPYILELEKAVSSGNVPDSVFRQMNDYPITEYEAEHKNVEEKLLDLKNIIIKYLPDTNNDKPFFMILKELFALENDLNDHARIEDLILVPKVETMETALKSKNKENDTQA